MICRLNAQVDTTLQVMMNENSMDYMAKFADLAAQMDIAASANIELQRNASSKVTQDKQS